MKSYAIISLGCPRNLVDSEVISGYLSACGLKKVEPECGADILLVNTCAFVESAREESVEAVLGAAELKKAGKTKRIVVCGCLPQMYKGNLSRSLPEADLIVGTGDVPRLPELIKGLDGDHERSVVSKRPDYLYDHLTPRKSLTPGHYAYVKISEGCSNRCSYCVIPDLRGAHRSRSIESVMEEVRRISRSGRVKEIEIVGQDTTLFGADRYGRPALAGLLRNISALDNGIEWIRLLYTHPAHYTDELIDAIASEEKICKYLDLPIQHISDRILRAMNRRVTKREISGLIRNLRRRIGGLTLRTSVIVGFPGETEREYKELVDFIKDTGFERLGAFTYSRERGTPASRLPRQVSDAVKRERLDGIMRIQQKISLSANRRFVGKTVDVLIDEKAALEDNKFEGRTRRDAPEIDGVVYVTGRGIKAGDICRVRITDALEYDLIGEKVGN